MYGNISGFVVYSRRYKIVFINQYGHARFLQGMGDARGRPRDILRVGNYLFRSGGAGGESGPSGRYAEIRGHVARVDGVAEGAAGRCRGMAGEYVLGHALVSSHGGEPPGCASGCVE